MIKKPIIFSFLVFSLVFWNLQKTRSQTTPQFSFPVQCTLEKDCWVVNHVDVDTSETAADFTCAEKTYNNHKGTDFAVRSLAEMNDGVDVLAALDGEVLRMRDSQSDTPKTDQEFEAIKAAKKECGNGILIDHGSAGFSGLRSMYCHLKQGSITVKPKDKVTAGQKIAEVGHSGLAEFPHLHFGVLWEGGIIDPYTGLSSADGCGKVKQSLWENPESMTYIPASMYDLGFRVGVPDFEAIKKGEKNPQSLGQDSAALVFWIALYGVQKDDQIRIEIKDPDGKIFITRDIVQEKTRARQYYYTGRKLESRQLKPGTYTGTATLKRAGKTDITRQETILIR